MDIPAVLASLPVEIRFYAKQGLFLVPFLGTHLKRAGHLPVARGDARASVKSMALGARLIQERNVSMLLFPEGGRSRGPMREFKEGAAYIAIKAGVPIPTAGMKLHDRSQLIARLEREVAELSGQPAQQPVETPRPV
jgi:1-acyl-sn-glycerol-3-phosphate acyltransferase